MLSSLSPEDLIPADHPIRRIRGVVDVVLAELDGEFEAMYATGGRPSVPPEQLLKATVLMALYSIRSERQFCERLNYDLVFKWFLGLAIDDRAFDPSTFTKNRDRLLDHEIAERFFAAVVEQARLRRYVSSDHFSVDGTVLEAWASHKSFKPKDRDPSEPPPAGRNSVQGRHEPLEGVLVDRTVLRGRRRVGRVSAAELDRGARPDPQGARCRGGCCNDARTCRRTERDLQGCEAWRPVPLPTRRHHECRWRDCRGVPRARLSWRRTPGHAASGLVAPRAPRR